MSNLVKNTSLAEFSGDDSEETRPPNTDDTVNETPARFRNESTDSYPSELILYSSTYRLLGVTVNANPLYAAANADHNGLTPNASDDVISPAFDVLRVPSNLFADAVPDDKTVVNTDSLDKREIQNESDEWDELVEETSNPVTRSECIDTFTDFRWQDTTPYLRAISNPSLDAFPEHLSHKGNSLHLVGVTTTGLAYYDTMDLPHYTVCTLVDEEVVEFSPHTSCVSINALSTNHLPYAQYLARIAIEGDEWVDLTSIGKTYVSDYIDSINELTELVE